MNFFNFFSTVKSHPDIKLSLQYGVIPLVPFIGYSIFSSPVIPDPAAALLG